MKILILLIPFLLTSCSSYIRTLGTRMISPEAQGEFGSGSLEARLQSSKRDKLDFSNDSTKNAIERADAPYALSGMGELGILERLDIYVIPSLILAPTIMGLKYQFIGNPRMTAKRGNFSASILLGYGSRSETDVSSDDLEDFFNENIEELEVKTKHQDVGLIFGHRWSEKILHYANVIYLHETVDGKVTTDSGTLSDAKYKFEQDGMIYSTGFIIYFSKAHWKIDYSHFVSDWTRTEKQTVNSVNTAIGFNW